MALDANSSESPALVQEGAVARFFRATEIDTRMLGMIAAILVVWCIFDIWSGTKIANEGLFGGSFLTPRNLWTLLVQTASIAIMATGMVLVIVMRHIDLSVGSLLTLVATISAVLQVQHLGPALGVGHWSIWILATVAALSVGVFVGACNGYMIAYLGIPSFIVTLGGLIAYGRGIGFYISEGVTIAPLDKTFKIVGGGVPESWLGPFWSWVLAVIACAAIAYAVYSGRKQRLRFNFPLRPMWAELLITGLASATVLGATHIVNSYPWPPKLIEQFALANQITIPPGVENRDGTGVCMAADKVVRCVDGLIFYTGYPVPVLIALAVGLVMTFIATRTLFGRYVYAIGGNPEAAELAGINTKLMTVKVFALMGFLAAVSAIVASARLDAATVSLGDLNELYVIAAAVIGGTSLAGGLGTIYGAMLGALLMQSIASGMQLLNLPSAWQNIVVGSVLVVAVFVDQIYRRRVK
ncbi:MAG: sugar ABC transporter permease [Proteobacteria bacterium]|nr:sugar ABC transporter permease [Pseudomonadota bacterium]